MRSDRHLPRRRITGYTTQTEPDGHTYHYDELECGHTALIRHDTTASGRERKRTGRHYRQCRACGRTGATTR
jgi:hypothetical protein